MASHLLLLLQPLFILFLLLITINHHLLPAQATQSNHKFLLKVTKDLETLQYTTHLLIGSTPKKLVVDLSGHSLWINCPPSSPSRNFITHRSLQCLMAKSGIIQKSTTKTSPNINCLVHQQNPITKESSFGHLAEDVITTTTDGHAGPISTRFLFSCSPEYLLKGLVNGADGVLGFGRSKIAFQSQMVNSFDFPRKFTVCLSSSDHGFIIPGTSRIISNSLSYTPLLMSSNNGYYVNVNSIKVNGRRLVNGQPIGGVEISSTVPYTVMKSTVYEIFKRAFVAAAVGAMNMTVVSPVEPFGVCFSGSKQVVPEIELVLQSELVRWRIKGMVEVSDSVMCLGFVDGGLGMTGSMVLGGYQLEDHVLEFDMGRGMMGFSSSLLTEGDSCSSIGANLGSMMISRESL